MEILAILKALPWKQIAKFVAIAVLVWLGYLTVHRAWWDLPTARDELKTAQASLKLEEDCADGSKCSERQKALSDQAAKVTSDITNEYEKELADLRARPVPTGPVRLCRPSSSSDVRVPPAPSGSPSSQASGVLGEQDGGDYSAGPDIGPALRGLAREAEEESAGKRAIIKRDDALSDATSAAGH